MLRDSSTRSPLPEDTSFPTDKLLRGLQDAFSLQNVEAPTCGLVPLTREWRSPREAPGACPRKQGAAGGKPTSQHGAFAVKKSPEAQEVWSGSVEAGARKLDSRLKRDVQIFAGLNKQPSELQLQRGWRWGRTQLAPVCVSKVVTT